MDQNDIMDPGTALLYSQQAFQLRQRFHNKADLYRYFEVSMVSTCPPYP